MRGSGLAGNGQGRPVGVFWLIQAAPSGGPGAEGSFES